MMKWGKPRMRGEEGSALVFLKCDNGFATAIKETSTVRTTRQRWYPHACSESARHMAGGEQRNRRFDGPQNCGMYHIKDIDTLADLPSSFSRFFWLRYNLEQAGVWAE
ncbi:hypothetical protein B0H16DRAFT_1705551 [Mycena metata]|uniref:Uncharacterized protein n=1 Tax=Mycena metata TaxID=1033252 RepID=A0AAD7DY22_9AGAR|nr:hypothetical protein B0H16DRAFT_1705551 [Mycena metata]